MYCFESETNESMMKVSLQPFTSDPFVFQWFGDEGQRAASSALPRQRASARRLPEEVQAVDGGQEQLLEEEAAAMSLRRPEDGSPSAGGRPQTRWRLRPGRHLLGASAAEPGRRRLCGEEEQTLLPDQRAGGSAAETELHRGRGRARSGAERGQETERQSETESSRRDAGAAGERLQRSEFDLHDQRGLFLRLHAGHPDGPHAAGLMLMLTG